MTEETEAPTNNDKLIAALTAERDKRAEQLLNNDAHWSRLAGAVDALSGRYSVTEDANNEGNQKAVG